MNRLSIFLPALTLALALALPGTATTREPVAGRAAALQEKDRFQIVYYWYTYPADTYNDHESLVVEELEWWIVLGGVPVNTSPAGGTLIARGYLTNAYPHTYFASEYLYAHY